MAVYLALEQQTEVIVFLGQHLSMAHVAVSRMPVPCLMYQALLAELNSFNEIIGKRNGEYGNVPTEESMRKE